MVQPAGATNTDNKSQQKVIVIDKEKSYPEKKLELKSKESFIRLETKTGFLLGQDAHIYYISDKRMLITNALNGDVLIFDMNGKGLSRFNQKGGNGYAFLKYAMYDEPKEEVYIVDITKKICVFSETGALKRTLHLPTSTDITEIYNFDENTLLAFNEYQYGPIKEKQPYLFISKKDGKILSRLNITTDKATPRVLITDKGMSSIGNNFSGNCKFGNDFILANMSCDTIYLLKQDKSLTPLFVQTPSVFSEHPVMTMVGMKTDDFIIFSKFPYNLKSTRKLPPDGGVKYFMYEFKTGQFYSLQKNQYWAEKIDIPKNMHVEIFECYVLKEWLKRGYLKGKMKELASKVAINDNAVIWINKFD
jgi:hypothetical protein